MRVTYAGYVFGTTFYDVEVTITGKTMSEALALVEHARAAVLREHPTWCANGERVEASTWGQGRAYVVLAFATDDNR